MIINFVWFFIYSVLGWIWEECYCSIRQKKLVYRGFLNGPYCPIYGFGALLVINLLGSIEQTMIIFGAGMLITCVLEYITSWLMEKCFHTRWWDYSDRKLNINGRVCMAGALAFGLFSVIVIKWLHPWIRSYIELLPEGGIILFAAITNLLMFLDTIYTVKAFSKFEDKLREFNDKWNKVVENMEEQRQALVQKIQDYDLQQKRKNILMEIDLKLNPQERRMIKAFPKLSSKKYKDILNQIKQYLHKK